MASTSSAASDSPCCVAFVFAVGVVDVVENAPGMDENR